jgi:hypothetical protein
VLHAEPNLVSRLIAAWPPAALAITVELISRVPAASKGLSAVRLAGTAVVAGIAAWVSYRHMAGVAARYGEDAASAHLIPLSVDGLVVVASVCLVEISRHIRAVTPPVAQVAPTLAPPAPAAAPVAPVAPVPAPAVPATAPVVPAAVSVAPPGAPVAPAHAPGAQPAAFMPVPPVGERRRALADLLARLPPGDARSASELAADLGPRVGLRSSTARKYIGAIRNGNAPARNGNAPARNGDAPAPD